MSILMKILKKTPSPVNKEMGMDTLSIDGIPPAPLTPDSDDAEQSAQHILELMSRRKRKNRRNMSVHADQSQAYYQAIADRIREAHRLSALRATRFVAFCEQELQNPHLPLYGPGSVQLLETELYKRLDAVSREGGELKRRWQHCIAEVTVRLMEAPPHETKEPECDVPVIPSPGTTN